MGEQKKMTRTPEETDDAHDDKTQVRRRQREVDDLRRDEDAPSFSTAHMYTQVRRGDTYGGRRRIKNGNGRKIGQFSLV